ncbi:aldehyde dehydrogenase family protein, partial [Streptacidiphilus albus]
MNTLPVWSVDARTGAESAQVTVESTAEDVDRAVRAARAALPALAARPARAALLRAAAELLERRSEALIAA